MQPPIQIITYNRHWSYLNATQHLSELAFDFLQILSEGYFVNRIVSYDQK